ncbi:hypothetical protein [Spongiactinospora sp. TRM90649]|uniref:hypothetical protein n=1 Tax=Spongiactinospora sp. TRM90649 TaxID=3031114 RepID=UPI0023F6A5CF|nr:hypothetical protein [Spongiactinospora sp. TRM90649]MDF5753541.1 hypothetical protein [Spongiactinospora sp. TRM90649]
MHCDLAPCDRPVAPGFRLCLACRNALRVSLRSLPGLFRECERRLVPGPRGLTQRLSRLSRPSGIVLNEAAVHARAEMESVLASWCALVAEERRTHGPAGLGVPELTSYLELHLTWLAAHPAVGDLVSEVANLVTLANTVLEPAASPVALGTCSRPGCPRTVHLRHDEGDLVRCTAGHVFAPHEWLALSLRTRRAEPEPAV